MTYFRAISRFTVTASLAFGAAGAYADVPRQFTFQGRLPAVSDPSASLTIRLWSASTGGAALFTETHNGVPLTDGVFSIAIGAVAGGVPETAVGALPVWLGVSVNGAAELTPRTRLQSVPFAFKSLGAEQLIIPGSFDTAATVGQDGHVTVEQRVEIGAAGDAGGFLSVRNAANAQTVRVDGEEAAGGQIEVFNGAQTNVATVVVNGNDSNDSVIEMSDGGGFDAFRIHSDLWNNAPEFSMFVGATNLPTRETVQIQANFDGGSSGAGEVRLRRVDPETNEAITTVRLSATSDNAQDLPLAGGELVLSHANGTPVFTVHAGDGASALSPSWMELRNASDDRRFYASASGLSFYNISDVQTINFSAANGDATFDGDLNVLGEASVGVLNITGGADLSERFDVTAGNARVEPGMVVCIDPENPGALMISQKRYDRTVAGVISGAGGVKPGMLMSQTGTIADGSSPVALTGRVWVWCDATTEPVAPGDLLTTADTPGHAMRATDSTRSPGATIGKAMTHLTRGERGLVLTLINLQ